MRRCRRRPSAAARGSPPPRACAGSRSSAARRRPSPDTCALVSTPTTFLLEPEREDRLGDVAVQRHDPAHVPDDDRLAADVLNAGGEDRRSLDGRGSARRGVRSLLRRRPAQRAPPRRGAVPSRRHPDPERSMLREGELPDAESVAVGADDGPTRGDEHAVELRVGVRVRLARRECARAVPVRPRRRSLARRCRRSTGMRPCTTIVNCEPWAVRVTAAICPLPTRYEERISSSSSIRLPSA